MAQTYNRLPFNVSELFRSLVATVSDNLGFEINYKAETWNGLCTRIKDVNSDAPLIALIENYDEEVKPDDPYIHTSVNLVIAKKSNIGWLSEKRQELNFTPWLYPIYAEFMEVISASSYFQGPHRPHPPHRVTKSYNLGNSDANTSGMKLPDSWDALIVSGLQLRVNRQQVAGFCYGPSLRLMYLNVIKNIVVSAIMETSISVETLDADYLAVVPQGTPVYRVYFEHDDSTEVINVGDEVVRDLVNAPAGNYVGRVECADNLCTASLAFFYSVNSEGKIYKTSTQSTYEVTPSTAGFEYTTYPVAVKASIRASLPCIMSSEIINDFVETTDLITFEVPVVDSGDHEAQMQQEGEGYRAVRHVNKISSVANTSFELTSYAYYKTQSF